VFRYVLAFRNPSTLLGFQRPSLPLGIRTPHLRSFQEGRQVIESRPCL